MDMHMDKSYKEFFKIYITECEKTRELIKEENEQTRHLLFIEGADYDYKRYFIRCMPLDSMKLFKEILAQLKRSEFKEDMNDAKMSIEKTWNEKYKNRNGLF